MAAGQVGPPCRGLLAGCEQPGLRSAGVQPNLADQSPADYPETTGKLDSLEFPSPRPAVWPDHAWCQSTATQQAALPVLTQGGGKGHAARYRVVTQAYLDLVDHVLAENSLLDQSIVEV